MKKSNKKKIEEIDNEIEALYNEHGYYAPFDIIPSNIPKWVEKIKILEEERKKLMEEK